MAWGLIFGFEAWVTGTCTDTRLHGTRACVIGLVSRRNPGGVHSPVSDSACPLKLCPWKPSALPCALHPPACRALQIGELEVHAVSYEQQQAAEDSRIAGATPGSPAAIYKQEA